MSLITINLNIDGTPIASFLERIMTAISDFADKQKKFNDDVGKAIDSIADSQAGLAKDITSLNEKIANLQNTPGNITPQDQALLDGIEADGKAMAAKAGAVATALAALDALTPPPAPVPAPEPIPE